MRVKWKRGHNQVDKLRDKPRAQSVLLDKIAQRLHKMLPARAGMWRNGWDSSGLLRHACSQQWCSYSVQPAVV